jgi:DNA topoisomerase-1
MVNAYIKRISNGDFTAKDFRTWAGSLQALRAFKDIGPANSINIAKKNTVQVLDVVAKHLGNTRTVCKKYYVHPLIIERYAENTLNRYLQQIDDTACDISIELNSAEQVLMKILQTTNAAFETLSKAS